jgi:hypothetical protein
MKDLLGITVGDFIKEKPEPENGLRNFLTENIKIIKIIQTKCVQ